MVSGFGFFFHKLITNWKLAVSSSPSVGYCVSPDRKMLVVSRRSGSVRQQCDNFERHRHTETHTCKIQPRNPINQTDPNNKFALDDVRNWASAPPGGADGLLPKQQFRLSFPSPVFDGICAEWHRKSVRWLEELDAQQTLSDNQPRSRRNVWNSWPMGIESFIRLFSEWLIRLYIIIIFFSILY